MCLCENLRQRPDFFAIIVLMTLCARPYSFQWHTQSSTISSILCQHLHRRTTSEPPCTFPQSGLPNSSPRSFGILLLIASFCATTILCCASIAPARRSTGLYLSYPTLPVPSRTPLGAPPAFDDFALRWHTASAGESAAVEGLVLRVRSEDERRGRRVGAMVSVMRKVVRVYLARRGALGQDLLAGPC